MRIELKGEDDLSKGGVILLEQFAPVVFPKSWLSVHQLKIEIGDRVMEEKKEWLYFFASKGEAQ